MSNRSASDALGSIADMQRLGTGEKLSFQYLRASLGHSGLLNQAFLDSLSPRETQVENTAFTLEIAHIANVY